MQFFAQPSYDLRSRSKLVDSARAANYVGQPNIWSLGRSCKNIVAKMLCCQFVCVFWVCYSK